MLRALLLSVPLFLTTSCLHHFVPRSSEKAESLRSNIESWTPPESVPTFGRSRSHQIFETKKLKTVGKVMSFDGGRMGMLAVISKDGYALTAAHVLREGEESCIIASDSKTKRLHLTLLRLKIKEQNKKKKIPFLQAYPPKKIGLEGVDPKTISSKNIRVIHRFPSRDLVLVKLPQGGNTHFTLGERPSQGDLVFSSGNSCASQPGSSSGIVKKITDRNLIISTMPLASGDSGGPVMNANGDLIGIAVQVRPGNFNTVRFINHSGIELVPKQEVLKLVEQDRKRPTR